MQEERVQKLLKLLKSRKRIEKQIDKEISSLSIDNRSSLAVFLYEYYKSIEEPKSWSEIGSIVNLSRQAIHQYRTRSIVATSTILNNGYSTLNNPWDYFQTPPAIVTLVIDKPIFNTLQAGDCVLEPSAGCGQLASGLKKRLVNTQVALECCEILKVNQQILLSQGFTLVNDDFLKYRPQKRYKAIVMNPPFNTALDRYAYITHIMHAWNLLADDGFLTSIAPFGYTYHSTRTSQDFLNFVLAYGYIEHLPDKSFHDSGTDSPITLITLKK